MREDYSDSQRIQNAMQELRDEAVPDSAKAKLYEAVGVRKGNRIRIPMVATACAVLFGLVVMLWPERKAMAWQQVVKSTLGTTCIHRVSFQRGFEGGNWVKNCDEWIEGKKDAIKEILVTRPGIPQLVVDMRYDGKRFYRVNWNGYGEVYDFNRSGPRTDVMSRYSLESILGDARLKIDKSPSEAVLNGTHVLQYSAKAYEGPVKYGFSTQVYFYVEKESGRIVKSEMLDKQGKTTEYSLFDYPNTVPSSLFLPPTNGLRVFDLDRDTQMVRDRMAKGASLGHGNILRAVIQSPDGELAVLWTGTPPNADGAQPPVVVGHPSNGTFAPDEITASRWKCSAKELFRFDGQTLCGLCLRVKKPVVGRVTLRIPILVEDHSSPIKDRRGVVRGYRSKQVGTATVRDYPVIQTIPFTVIRSMEGNHES